MPKPKKPKPEVWRNPFEEVSKQMAETMRKAIEEVNRKFSNVHFNPSPELAGWMKLMKLLKEASQDKEVMGSPQAIALIEKLLELVGKLDVNSTADDAFKPLAPQFISSNARAIASKRFNPERKIREWVVSEWMGKKTEFKDNKSRFARRYAQILLEERKLLVTERNIRERWLKGL